MLLPGRSSVVTSSTWALSRDGPGTSISQCYDRHPSHGPAAAHPGVTPGGWTPGGPDQPPAGPPSWLQAWREAGGAAGARGAACFHRPLPVGTSCEASQPGSPVSLPSSFRATPFGPALGHSPASGAHQPARSHLAGRPPDPPTPVPSSRSTQPAPRGPRCPRRSDLPHPTRLQPQALRRLCLPLHPLTALASQRRPQPSGLRWPVQLSSSGTSLNPHLPASLATFGASRRGG